MFVYRCSMSAIACCALPFVALAQEENSDVYDLVSNQSGTKIEFAYGVPASPALAIAGLEAKEVTKVNEVRKFVASLPSALNGDGETAIGIDIRPGLFFSNRVVDYTEDNALLKRARRSVVSFALKEGKDDNDDPAKSTRSLLSIGVSTSVLDGSDPIEALFDDGNANVKDACRNAYSVTLLDYQNALLQRSPDGERFRSYSWDAYYEVESVQRALLNFQQNQADDLRLELIGARQKLVRARDLLKANLKSGNSMPDAIDINFPKVPNDLTSQDTLRRFAATLDDVRQILENEFRTDKYERAFVYADPQRVQQEYAAVVDQSKKCTEAVNKAVKFAPNLDIGAGVLWRGEGAELGDFQSGGSAVWLSFRYPLGVKNVVGEGPQSYWVAGLSGRFGFDEFVSTGDDTLKEAEADTAQVWGGIEYVSSNWRGHARYGFVETDFSSSDAASFSSDGDRWLVGTDFRLGEESNIWLGLEYGEADGTIDTLQGETFKVSFKFSNPAALNIFSLPD